MTIICPGCGRRFDPARELGAQLAVTDTSGKAAVRVLEPLELQPDGTAFRALVEGEERHIDQRVRCKVCSVHQR